MQETLQPRMPFEFLPSDEPGATMATEPAAAQEEEWEQQVVAVVTQDEPLAPISDDMAISEVSQR